MSNFWKRAITGTLYVCVVVGAVLFNQFSFLGLLLLICFFCLTEFVKLFKNKAFGPPAYATIVIGVIYFLLRELNSAQILPQYTINFAHPLLFVVFIVELFATKRRSFTSASIGVGGIIYISFSLWCFTEVGYLGGTYHPDVILGYFILIWCSDTFAYIVGNLIGKTKLFKSISPKKTWEGSIGGAVFTIAASVLLYKFYPGTLRLFEWLGLATIIVVFGVIGDLVKSMLKRNSGVKDSGTILPGHGGVLDRMDSLLFSAPFAMAFLRLAIIFFQ